MLVHETDYPKKFVDTVCHQSSFSNHLKDVDCHYKEVIQLLTDEPHTCVIEFPYPLEKKIQPSDASPPSIFTLTNYHTRLKKVSCYSVYRQYSIIEIHEAIASGILMKPERSIAPMKTSIQFFEGTIPLPMAPVNGNIKSTIKHSTTTYNWTYSVSRANFDTIQSSILPSYFNWVEHTQITKPQDQGVCGSCWAVAASTCLSDVFVVSKQIPNPQLSWSYLLSCMPQHQCEGGNPFLAIQEMSLHGTRNHECINNSLTTDIPVCKCIKSSPVYFPTDTKVICIPPDLTKFSDTEANVLQSYLNQLYGTTTSFDLSSVSYTTIQKIIIHHIFHHGPVVTGFHVFKNFLKGDFRETNDIYIETESYRGVKGINYKDLEEDWIGSHAVVIVGWGQALVRNHTVFYWEVRNSWGSTWGTNGGMFKIAMYGTTPLQNRVSQFEYPSLVTTDTGYGVTGGVLLIKAGDILPPTIEAVLPENRVIPLRKKTWFPYSIFLLTVCLLLILVMRKPFEWWFGTSIIIAIIIAWVLFFVTEAHVLLN